MNRMKILIMALLVTACIKNGGEAAEEPLLKDFALKVNELHLYHGTSQQCHLKSGRTVLVQHLHYMQQEAVPGMM